MKPGKTTNVQPFGYDASAILRITKKTIFNELMCSLNIQYCYYHVHTVLNVIIPYIMTIKAYYSLLVSLCRCRYLVGTGDAVFLTAVIDPGVLPAAAVALFVGVAGQQGDQRQQVQAAEDTDADHELLQLLLVPLVVLDHLPNVVEGDDTCQNEDEADYDAHTQRRQNEVSEGVQVVEAHEANSTDAVSFHLV